MQLRILVVLLATITVAACGGGGGSSTPTTPSPSPSPSPTPTPSPSPTPSGVTTFTVTSAGVSPRSLTVVAGTRLTFVNNDSRPHDMSSDPHPAHTDCVEINQVGFLSPNQSRQTGNMTAIRTCGFHDHDQPTNTALQGTIVIVAQ